MENKILIYTPVITPRIQYIFDFVLKEFSGIDFEFTSDLGLFESAQLPRINYSKENIADTIFLKSDEFLVENNISQNIRFDDLNDIGKLFFALTRYEEYRPQVRDIHDRITGKNKVYKTPFVDTWILNFQKELNSQYSHLKFNKREFEMILTCDVDQAWKYKHTGFIRTYGGFIKDLAKFDFGQFNLRRQVISGRMSDAFETFEYFRELISGNSKDGQKVRMIFFWLMGDYNKFDRNNPVNNPYFIELIRSVSTWAETGIHPSYTSNFSPKNLKIEIERLEKCSGKKITKSRQHFIKLRLPETYRNLIENGIEEDYTMAYADETGFRAGTCTPFYWYDLSREEKTNLKVHSFCAMDVTLRNYMKLTPQKASEELMRLKSEIAKVDGQMITLFHNSNLNGDWEDWKEVLESIF